MKHYQLHTMIYEQVYQYMRATTPVSLRKSFALLSDHHTNKA